MCRYSLHLLSALINSQKTCFDTGFEHRYTVRTMMFRNLCLLVMSSAVVTGQYHNKLNASMIMYEDYITDVDPTEGAPQHHLRRQLQTTQPVCQATNPVGSVHGDCGGTYPCSCSGLAETACSYCELQTSRGKLCQMTGSSTTYSDKALGIRTCSCAYIGNGQTRQNCYIPTPRPTNAPVQVPPVLPPTPVPVVDRAPVGSVPMTPAVPLPVQPASTVAPVPPIQAGCRATNPYNVYMCIESSGTPSDFCEKTLVSCDMLPEYSCSCSGLNPTETWCSYCQVRTANSVVCQVTGNSMRFVAPDFTTQTCSCEYVGNGQVQQVCYTPTPAPISTPTQGASNLVTAASWDMP
jgi:hypothetical protein